MIENMKQKQLWIIIIDEQSDNNYISSIIESF